MALLLTLNSLSSFTYAAIPVSISSYSPYLEQRACVKNCVWAEGSGDLVSRIGCSSPRVNECYCHFEFASTASSFLSSCVARGCTTTNIAPIVTSACSVYNAYCAANNLPIPTVASIKSYSEYLSQPTCVRDCLWHAGQDTDDLMPNMGCRAPWDNGCLCNVTLANTASVFISTCVASRCGASTDGPQVTSALSVHEDYCSSAGLPLHVLAAGTDATTGSIATAASKEPSSGMTSKILMRLYTHRNSLTHWIVAGLSTGAIAGMAVSSTVAVIAIVAFAAFVFFKKRKHKPNPTEERTAAASIVHEKPAEQEVTEADATSTPRPGELYRTAIRAIPAAELPS